ncbi:MAG: DUF1016 domain-containing protein [Firmicutes bacterium]|nr:DUF1016 domain-containing protein [Bacillota bacterium]
MNYYSEIKNRLIENENYARIKDYSKERYKVQTYYEVGKMLSEAGKCYGEGIIKKYSELLSKELNKKYSYRSLIYMLRFYELQKVQSMTANLSWGHWIELLSIKDIEKIKYYVYQTEYNCLTTRELRQRIKNKEYERLDDSTKQKLINKEEFTIQDNIKNPIIIYNKNNRSLVTEKDLQNIIIENIASFLKELGNKFCFIDNEYKIKIGDSYNYIDLLLYNSEYHCYVVVELKITELKKEYIGQIETYMNYVDKNIKDIIDNKTIGIIICKKDNKFIMEYCSDSRILSRFYEIK